MLNDIDFTKKTTKYNRISTESLTRESILKLTKIMDLKNIVSVKKLNVRGGGQIVANKINADNFGEYKTLVANILFPQE